MMDEAQASVTDRCAVLLAGLPESVLGALQAKRPRWQIVDLDQGEWQAQALPEAFPIFAFVDWVPPAMSGLEMVRRLRDRPQSAGAHVTMVLDGSDASARSRALAAGADDYTAAPLDADAVIARVEDLARSNNGTACSVASRANGQALPHGALVVDPAAYMVRQADRTVRLRRNEFDILMHFMRRPNQVLSRQALVDQIGKGGMIGERTVDRRIARLRKTLGDHAIADPIRTVYGVGYVFDAVD